MWYRRFVRWLPLVLCLTVLAASLPAAAQPADLEPGRMDQALYSEDAAVRARAARQAAAQGEREAAERLLELLRDRDRRVRVAAADALAALQIQRATLPLKVLAQTDHEPVVRAAAARAVLRLDPKGYASTLATADLPPVVPEPKEPEEEALRSTTSRGRAVLLGAGLAVDGMRADETLSGQVAAGLRWPHVDIQLTLNFPALALVGQVRLNLLASFWLVPYISVGAAIIYNNGDETPSGDAGALLAGGGVRLGPFGRQDPTAFASRLYGYAEVQISWVFHQPTPPNHVGELETLALPVVAGLGLELWP